MRVQNAVVVRIGSQELATAHTITQIVEVIPKKGACGAMQLSGRDRSLTGSAREKRLLELLKEYHPEKKNLILIFALYKREVHALLCMRV